MAKMCVVWCAAVGGGKGKRSGMGKWCSVRLTNEGVKPGRKEGKKEGRKEREWKKEGEGNKMIKFEHEKWMSFIFEVHAMKAGSIPIPGCLLQEIMLIFPKFLVDSLLGQEYGMN